MWERSLTFRSLAILTEHLGLTALIPLPIISNFAREQFTGVLSTEINGDLNA